MTRDSDPTAPTRDTVEGPSAISDQFRDPNWSQEGQIRERIVGTGEDTRERTRVRVRLRTFLARLTPGRRVRRTGKKSPRRRALCWGLGIVAMLVILTVAWLAYSSLRVRSDLRAVRAGVHEMRAQLAAGDLTAARDTSRSIRSQAQSARNFTAGPVWALVSHLPAVGEPFATVRALTSSVNRIANDAVTPLIDTIGTFQSGRLRTSSGAFDLAAIEHLAPTVGTAHGALTAAIRELRQSSGSTWLSPVNHARSELIDQLAPLSRDLAQLHRAVAVVPQVLGAHGPRTYMITFQNDAEARGTGGLPGAFAIVRTDQGRVEFTHFESDNYLLHVHAKGLDFGPNYAHLFPRARWDYRNSNYSPNFPYAGQIWSSMYQEKTGQPLDGAVNIDPTALKYLLKVSGPTSLPEGGRLSARNVVGLTEHQLYIRYASQTKERKSVLREIARAASKKLLSPAVNFYRLLHAAARAATQHRLLFWSRDRTVESELSTVPLGGVVPTTREPYVALALNNREHSKLNYYLHASMDWKRTGCGPMRDVTVTVKLTNYAPRNLPKDIIGQPRMRRILSHGHSFPPGTQSLDTYLYGSVGGRFTSVKVGGRTPFHRIGHDRGHPVYEANVDVPPNGNPVTVVFRLKEPAWTGPVVVREQPLIKPMTTTVTDSHC